MLKIARLWCIFLIEAELRHEIFLHFESAALIRRDPVTM